jgi:NADH-quinone oxidoreductase subunit J
MSISVIVFYLLAASILFTGVLAVTTRHIFRSAIYLLGSLVGVAGIYFWMEVEFIAAVQVVVYVGGIVVLIIFSIFLTQQSGKEMPATPGGRTIAAAVATLSGFALTCLLISKYNFNKTTESFELPVNRVGTAMLNTGHGGFVLPFEVVSILLLAAMIGCIVIAMKPPSEAND